MSWVMHPLLCVVVVTFERLLGCVQCDNILQKDFFFQVAINDKKQNRAVNCRNMKDIKTPELCGAALGSCAVFGRGQTAELFTAIQQLCGTRP